MPAAAIAVAVVGWFVALTIKELIEWARSDEPKTFSAGLRHNLEQLADHLYAINSNVAPAATRFVTDVNVVAQLWQLKDAVHDAEELRDSLQYKILEARLGLKTRHRLISKAIDNAVADFLKAFFGTKDSRNLKKLLKRLDKHRESSNALQNLVASEPPPRWPTQTRGPLPKKEKVFGYRNEYRDLLHSLRGGGNEVVAIIGHGGMGKTELARQAFNDEGSKFKLHVWVNVYAKFTQLELLKEIWNSAFGTYPVGQMNESSLQVELEKKVKSEGSFLLVLDDVCHDESQPDNSSRRKIWEAVLAPFTKHKQMVGRILLTTRAEVCSRTLKAGARIVLDGIDKDKMMLLIQDSASRDRQDQVAHDAHELAQVLDDYVSRKLHGSPLAAEQVGSTLQGSKSNWVGKCLKIINDVDESVREVYLKTHLSSYQNLHPRLQRCLAFCSIFPNKWRFKRERLIKMWVALGFAAIENKATGYFNDLRQRSLFQPAGAGYYEIHEHIHSMTRLVAPGYYLSIDGDHDRAKAETIPVTVRHLSVTTGCLDLLEACVSPKRLRTLLVFRNDGDSSSSAAAASSTTASIDSSVLKRFKGVRVLDFSDTSISEVPESIGKLKKLRYLGLPYTISRVGDHVTKLLLLQTLSIAVDENWNCMLQDLPRGMSILTKMRHLDMRMEHIAQIGHIGSMGELQGSVEFHVGREDEGHGMRELEKLNSLSKVLTITSLEKVPSKHDAAEAQLTRKRHLKALKLQWGYRGGLQEQEAEAAAAADFAVLEGLQPNANLQMLHVEMYLGKTSPAWVTDPSVLRHLTSLHLCNCKQLQALPPVGGLPLLKLLVAKGLPSIQRIDGRSGKFPALERMVLEKMPGLVAWEAPDDDGATAQGGVRAFFPRLRWVKIVDCHILSSMWGLVYCSDSLTYVHVERCPKVLPPYYYLCGRT